MKTAARKRTLKTKPRYRQRDLFNEPKVNTTPLRKWRQPKIDRTDETWIYSFLDPHNLGVTVTIPAWMQGGQSR